MPANHRSGADMEEVARMASKDAVLKLNVTTLVRL